MRRHGAPSVLALALLAACAAPPGPVEPPPLPPGAEAWSLGGEALVPPELPPDVRADREARLAAAQADHDARPGDADALIWLGRRTAYLGRYREAIEIFTEGIERHPEDARMYRHRGHRYISTRRFERAIRDLRQAARLTAGAEDQVEPDGLPNARNTPTSTLQSNIWYHLGLAHYLAGDLDAALEAYRSCLAVSHNPDMLVATSHWLYMTLRLLGRDAEAARLLEPITADMDIIENTSYHELLLLYKGERSRDELLEAAASGTDLDNATLAYGIANHHATNGDAAGAREILERIVAGPQWAAFGFIAAEADLHR